MKTMLSVLFVTFVGCVGGLGTAPDAGSHECTSGIAPPAGDYCRPCEEVACPCDGAQGTATCETSGQGYGECVCPEGSTYTGPNPAWGGGLCGPVTTCPACDGSTGQCCHEDDGQATLDTCN